MSLQGLDDSDAGLLINTSCLNVTTIDLRNASTTVINYFVYVASNIPSDLKLIHQFLISMVCVSLFGLITNSSFLVTVVKTPSLHSSTYIFLTCLACSDCIMLGARLHHITQILFDYTATNASNKVSDCLSNFCFLLSTGFVILASTERFLAICHPLKYHKLKGTKRPTKLIAIVFLISVVGFSTFIVPLVLSHSKTQYCVIWPKNNKFLEYLHHHDHILTPKPETWRSIYNKILYLSFGLIYFLILAGVSYMYVKILTTLGKRKRNTNLQMSIEFQKHIEQVSVMVIVNGGVYFFLMSILITYLILLSFSFIESWQLGGFVSVTMSYTINASINPLLYFLTNERYRSAVKSVFTCCFRKAKNQQKTQSDSHKITNVMERQI